MMPDIATPRRAAGWRASLGAAMVFAAVLALAAAFGGTWTVVGVAVVSALMVVGVYGAMAVLLVIDAARRLLARQTAAARSEWMAVLAVVCIAALVSGGSALWAYGRQSGWW